jgi:transposase
VFADIFNHTLSVATLLNAESLCYTRLERVDESLRRALRGAPVVGFDESRVRVEGKLHWLHTACTQQLTGYLIHPKRGRAAMDEAGILPEFKGVSMHDALPSYFQYTLCTHALCNAHHLRELKLMFEHDEQGWAAAMAALLRDIWRVVKNHRQAGVSSLSERLAEGFERCYDEILQSALKEIPSLPDPPPDKRGRRKQPPAKNLYDRLLKHKEAVLRFMHDFQVPFDNNQAERDIRMIKAQQKISGTFRQVERAKVFCRIRGYISTAKKQGQNVLNALRSVFEGKTWMPVLDS